MGSLQAAAIGAGGQRVGLVHGHAHGGRAVGGSGQRYTLFLEHEAPAVQQRGTRWFVASRLQALF